MKGEIMDLLRLNDLILNSGFGIVVLLTLIQITPIKINPWDKLLKFIGRAINSELSEKMEGFKGDMETVSERFEGNLAALSEKVQGLQETVDENEAKNARARIVGFADKLLNSPEKSTRDKFESLLRDIDFYNDYCNTHPTFKNSIAGMSIKVIEKEYERCWEEKDFLVLSNHNIQNEEKEIKQTIK